MASSDELWLGKGSFWGSADVRLDDVMVYDRVLNLLDVMALQQMTDRSNIDGKTDGIAIMDNGKWIMDNGQWTDLQGRRVEKPAHGLYIRNGKKILVR